MGRLQYKRRYAAFCTCALVVILGALLIYWQFGYGARMRAERRETEAHLLKAAETTYLAVEATILKKITDTTSTRPHPNASARPDSLNALLKELKSLLDSIAVEDRTQSLDYVFDEFSMLLAVATLLAGFVGIFMAFQYLDLSARMGDIETRIQKAGKKLDVDVKHYEEITLKVVQAQAGLQARVEHGTLAMWHVANVVRRLSEKTGITDEDFHALMLRVELDLYRAQLFNLQPNKREAALFKFIAQGVCEDLSLMANIRSNPDEPQQLRDLAATAISEIRARCKTPHHNGHREMDRR